MTSSINYKISELFTEEELELAKIYAFNIDKLETEIVIPAIGRIDKLTTQLNSTKYLAYALQYAVTRA